MYTSKKIFQHLNRLSLFVLIVITVLAIKLTIKKKRLSICFDADCDMLAHQMTTVEFNHSELDSFIKIGDLNLQRSECMSRHLDILPEYARDALERANHTTESNISCIDILTNHNKTVSWKPLFKNISPSVVIIDDDEYLNLTQNCTYFKISRDFVLKPLSEDSRTFPIAFNFIVHKTACQVELLLRALYRPQNVFCIHIDSKSTSSFKKAIKSIANCFDNVHLASKFESITWGGFNRLQADITCMKDHLKRKSKWKYLINTAGQAFPLRTIEEMVQILRIYNGSNDIEGLYGNRLLKSRYENEWMEDAKTQTVQKTGKMNPKPPHDIDVVRGSAYGIFSRKFVKFIVSDKKAIDFLEWTRKTWSPDEIYWATLHHTYSNPHLHTPGGFSGYPMNKEWLAVYANWGELPCHGKSIRTVCVNGVDDLRNLVGRREFFVNKFYQEYEPLALGCLSAWIRFKEMCGVPFDAEFYRKLKFVVGRGNDFVSGNDDDGEGGETDGDHSTSDDSTE